MPPSPTGLVYKSKYESKKNGKSIVGFAIPFLFYSYFYFPAIFFSALAKRPVATLAPLSLT